jgi:hypothetical protein
MRGSIAPQSRTDLERTQDPPPLGECLPRRPSLAAGGFFSLPGPDCISGPRTHCDISPYHPPRASCLAPPSRKTVLPSRCIPPLSGARPVHPGSLPAASVHSNS